LRGTRLLLARHAETSAPDRFHGAESDIGLSAWGAQQSERLGYALADAGARALYSSSLRRARETAAIVGGICKLEVVEIPALHERRIGPLSGLSREEGWSTYAKCKERWMAGDLEYTHEGGESFAAISRRVVPILERLATEHSGDTILVIAHGVVIRVALISLLSGYSPVAFDRIAIDFASVNDLLFDGETWTARELHRIAAPSAVGPVA
jgi:2,3-bisphosphoglycerate-dependent phosphoglycerate mutase